MYSLKELKSMSGPELVKTFNNLPDTNPVKRFKNRETGVRRILSALGPITPDEASDIVQEIADSVIPKVELTTPKKRGRKRASRGMYNEPLGQTLRTCRKNSGRGRLLDLCLEGRTFKQLQEALPQWTEDMLHRHIRNMHFYLGYRLETSLAGVITAFAS